MNRIAAVTALLVVALGAAAEEEPAEEQAEGEPVPPAAELQAAGAIIGEIIYDRQNVFDPSKPGENNALYRLANRWHIVTRDSVIRNQLLFRPGDL